MPKCSCHIFYFIFKLYVKIILLIGSRKIHTQITPNSTQSNLFSPRMNFLKRISNSLNLQILLFIATNCKTLFSGLYSDIFSLLFLSVICKTKKLEFWRTKNILVDPIKGKFIKVLFKWMIWRYPHFRKLPYIYHKRNRIQLYT